MEYALWWNSSSGMALLSGGVYESREAALAAIPEVEREFLAQRPCGEEDAPLGGEWSVEETE